MFSGIVEALGQVIRTERCGGDLKLSLEAGGFAERLKPGDSVLVSGVCLTAAECSAQTFTMDVSGETLACTTLGDLQEGGVVNLERALRIGDTLDGHFVSGHVDAVARIVAFTTDARSERFEIEAPVAVAPLIAPKGAVALDGVSLTVNEVAEDVDNLKFGINVIPYTLENTTFSGKAPGDAVNLEVDLLARYIQRCLSPLNPRSRASKRPAGLPRRRRTS